MDAGEARYELVISVDARGSGQYSDAEKPLMRRHVYEVLETAFAQAGVGRNAVHLEDRGDGVLISVPGRIAVARLLGLWMTELHEKLRLDNRRERRPLGLRVAMHVGPVRHDSEGICGDAVNLACGLADSSVARHLLEREQADLVLAVSDSLYREVVAPGGKFIDPDRFAPARITLKGGEVTAWFQLPGRPAPALGKQSAPDMSPATPSGSPAADGQDHEDGDGDGDGRAEYRAGRDMNVFRDTTFERSVHIGHSIGTDRRKD
ncbi:hypothetical protein ACH4A7_14340 [Streptomyces cyaneofuscatus]|uniref:hypothetical protein n=1 Tax=Streptomyces cyaneofuscatus TaxID=66883 RepID=UPI0037B17C9C|nr:hypothetical protein OG973_17310 [Streptomyces cyaneofuscatus]